MQSDRNKLLAFLLNLIPGLGFLYWGRPARAVIYPLLFFGTAVGSFMLAMLVRERELMILGALGAIFFWCVSMLDMIIVLLRAPSPSDARYHGYGAHYSGPHRGRHTKENTLIRKATWDRWKWTKKEYISIKAVSMASPRAVWSTALSKR
ncbi:hypothetical protein [Paenibacillus sp. 1A_MP2]|uniref:hypothetical protein n=1 Tax=Paenibacillus sp. 1A_MP2 TaxID=3457495 RepID=UPI003FCD9D66